MSDYTYLPSVVVQYMKDNNTPLTREQEMVLIGSMSSMLMAVGALGLDVAVDKHKKANQKDN